jgi:hypothetical protein
MGIFTNDIINKAGSYSLIEKKFYLENYIDCYEYMKEQEEMGFTITRRADLEAKFGEICIEIHDPKDKDWVNYEQIWNEEEMSSGIRNLIRKNGWNWAIKNHWV